MPTTHDNPYSILDAAEADRLAQEGMARVDANANPQWKIVAFDSGVDAALIHQDLTSDQIWEVMSRRDPVWTHCNAAMGPITKALCKAGYIEKTDKFRKSERPQTHGRPLRVWKSLIY